jgi:hypothetical protein
MPNSLDRKEGFRRMAAHHLTLSEALRSGRLSDFIVQEEQRGVPKADAAILETAINLLIKDKPQEGRTSCSRVRGGSSGK